MNNADKYRPIGLLSCFKKVFENILHNKIMEFLDNHKVMLMYQYILHVVEMGQPVGKSFDYLQRAVIPRQNESAF